MAPAARRRLLVAGAIAVLLTCWYGCSTPRGEALVRKLRAESIAQVRIPGTADTGPVETSAGHGGDVGTPATVRRVLRAVTDTRTAARSIATVARSLGWRVDLGTIAGQPSLNGTKLIGDDTAQLVVSPIPRGDGRYGDQMELELSVRW